MALFWEIKHVKLAVGLHASFMWHVAHHSKFDMLGLECCIS